jgi:hypothetical protein
MDYRIRVAAETIKRYPWVSRDQDVAPAPSYVYDGKWSVDYNGEITVLPETEWNNGDLGDRSATHPSKSCSNSYCVVVVFMLPIATYWEPQSFRNIPHFSISVWVGFLILAFFQYYLAMVIFLSVLSRLEATQAAISNYLIPFFGVLIAAVVLHEKLTSYMALGELWCL